MKFHLSNLFNGRKALAEQEEASGEMNILKAGLLEKAGKCHCAGKTGGKADV